MFKKNDGTGGPNLCPQLLHPIAKYIFTLCSQSMSISVCISDDGLSLWWPVENSPFPPIGRKRAI